MDLKLDDIEILNLLQALRDARRQSIYYYEAHRDEEERIGVTSPEEWAELYNVIIKQMHEQGQYEILTPIKHKNKLEL